MISDPIITYKRRPRPFYRNGVYHTLDSKFNQTSSRPPRNAKAAPITISIMDANSISCIVIGIELSPTEGVSGVGVGAAGGTGVAGGIRVGIVVGIGACVGATNGTFVGSGVAVGGTGVAVGGTGVAVGGTGVAVGGTGVAVGGTGVGVAKAPASSVKVAIN